MLLNGSRCAWHEKSLSRNFKGGTFPPSDQGCRYMELVRGEPKGTSMYREIKIPFLDLITGPLVIFSTHSVCSTRYPGIVKLLLPDSPKFPTTAHEPITFAISGTQGSHFLYSSQPLDARSTYCARRIPSWNVRLINSTPAPTHPRVSATYNITHQQFVLATYNEKNILCYMLSHTRHCEWIAT